MHPLIQRHHREIVALCRRSHVRRLEIFGSASRGEDFDLEHSDVDFLVEFDPEHITPTLHTFFDLREQLASLIGRPVDLVMAGSIHNPYIRSDMELSRETIYAS